MSFMQLLRSLCENTVLVLIAAGCGLVTLGLGGNAVWKNSNITAGPKTVTMRELEAAASLPDANWLECHEAYFFWPEARRRVRSAPKAKVDPKFTDSTEGFYVPLLSKSAFDKWCAILERDGPEAFFPYDQCRVVVGISTAKLQDQFPDIAPALINEKPVDYRKIAPLTIRGPVRPLAEQEQFVVQGMSRKTSGFDPKMIFVLIQGGQVPNHAEMNRIAGIVICVFGLLGFVPLIPWAYLRWQKQKAEKPAMHSPQQPER